MHHTPTTNSQSFGGNESDNNGKIWELAYRNNQKPRIVKRRKVQSCKRLGVA